MSVLLVLNVNILAVRAIDQSCEIGLVLSVILDRQGGGETTILSDNFFAVLIFAKAYFHESLFS